MKEAVRLLKEKGLGEEEIKSFLNQLIEEKKKEEFNQYFKFQPLETLLKFTEHGNTKVQSEVIVEPSVKQSPDKKSKRTFSSRV